MNWDSQHIKGRAPQGFHKFTMYKLLKCRLNNVNTICVDLRLDCFILSDEEMTNPLFHIEFLLLVFIHICLTLSTAIVLNTSFLVERRKLHSNLINLYHKCLLTGCSKKNSTDLWFCN